MQVCPPQLLCRGGRKRANWIQHAIPKEVCCMLSSECKLTRIVQICGDKCHPYKLNQRKEAGVQHHCFTVKSNSFGIDLRLYFFTNMAPCTLCYRQVYKYKHMITSRGNVLYPATRVTQSQLYRKGCNKPHPVVVTAQIGRGTLYLAVEKPTQLMPLISVAAGGQCFVELVWYTASVSTFKVQLPLLQKYAKEQLQGVNVTKISLQDFPTDTLQPFVCS